MKKSFTLFICVTAFTLSAIKAQTITDADGNAYNTIAIGTQLWMKENLKTTKFRDGSSITNVTDPNTWLSLTTEAYCNYSNTPSNANIWGRLYNWYAVSDTRELCPAGWHVPSDYDWTILQNYLYVNGYNYDGTTTGGNKIAKALSSTTHWVASSVAGAPGNSDYPSVRNSSGFSSLPNGYRSTGGSYNNLGESSYFWTSTPYNSGSSYRYAMDYDNPILWRNFFSNVYGAAVRCICDLPVSINETKKSSNINIYPNPSSDFIVIDGLNNDNSIEIVNLQGQVVKNLKVSNIKTTLEISELPKGIYFIRINSNEELHISKFLKL
jgi:uncharacterized protein (TIGR02145 family)